MTFYILKKYIYILKFCKDSLCFYRFSLLYPEKQIKNPDWKKHNNYKTTESTQ